MSKEFTSGPFLYRAELRLVKINGTPRRAWAMSYNGRTLQELHVPAEATEDDVREAFSDSRAAFIKQERDAAEPDVLSFESHDGTPLASVAVLRWPQGMSAGIPDDRFATWLVTTRRPRSCVPMTVAEFAAYSLQHAAPPMAWVAGLLPDDVLSTDPEEWRPPTSWELRHVVGEGSFTGISGAKAAVLIGVTPPNFRKYTARDDASTRQNISFAMWHLLLQRLGVQRV